MATSLIMTIMIPLTLGLFAAAAAEELSSK